MLGARNPPLSLWQAPQSPETRGRCRYVTGRDNLPADEACGLWQERQSILPAVMPR